MFLKFILFAFIKITYSTQAIENPISYSATLKESTRGPLKIVYRPKNNESIIIPLHENHYDDHATGSRCIIQGAKKLDHVKNNLDIINITEHQNLLMRQKKNDEIIPTIKTSLPDILLNLDKECKTFLRCVDKTNKTRNKADIDQETEVISENFSISILNKKKRKISMADSLSKFGQCANDLNYKNLHKKNKNDKLNIIHPLILAENDEYLIQIEIFDIDDKKKNSLLNTYSRYGCQDFLQYFNSDILQNQNPYIDSGKVSFSNTIKFMSLGIETLNTFALNQFINEKQLDYNDTKSVPCYLNSENNLRVANRNSFIVNRLGMIRSKNFEFDYVKTRFIDDNEIIIYYYKCIDTVYCQKMQEDKIEYIINSHFEAYDTKNAKDLKHTFIEYGYTNRNDTNINNTEVKKVHTNIDLQTFCVNIKLDSSYVNFITNMQKYQIDLKNATSIHFFAYLDHFMAMIGIESLPTNESNHNKCNDPGCFLNDSNLIGLCEKHFKVHMLILLLNYDKNKQKFILKKQYDIFLFMMEDFLHYFWYIFNNRELMFDDTQNRVFFFHWYDKQVLSYKRSNLHVLRLYFYIKIKNKIDNINNLLINNNFVQVVQLLTESCDDQPNQTAICNLKAAFVDLKYRLNQVIRFLYLPSWLTKKYKKLSDLAISNINRNSTSDLNIINRNFLFLIKDLTLQTKNQIVFDKNFLLCWNDNLKNTSNRANFSGLLNCYNGKLHVFNEAKSFLAFCRFYLEDGQAFARLANRCMEQYIIPGNFNERVSNMTYFFLTETNLFKAVYKDYLLRNYPFKDNNVECDEKL